MGEESRLSMVPDGKVLKDHLVSKVLNAKTDFPSKVAVACFFQKARSMDGFIAH
jgi:hypothetical protein